MATHPTPAVLIAVVVSIAAPVALDPVGSRSGSRPSRALSTPSPARTTYS